MGIKDQMKKKRKKQELLDDLPDYEVLGLADDDRSAAGTGSSGTEIRKNRRKSLGDISDLT